MEKESKPVQIWANEIKTHFAKVPKTDQAEFEVKVSSLLDSFFDQHSTNIYVAVKGLLSCLGTGSKAKSINYLTTILSRMGNYIKEHKSEAVLDVKTQKDVLDFLAQYGNRSTISSAFDAFRLLELSNEVHRNCVEKLLNRGMFTTAAYLVMQVKQQAEWDLKQIAIPLYLTDKTNVMEEFIKECPVTASRLITFFDSLTREFDIASKMVADTPLPINKVNPNYFLSANLSKLVSRLVKKYNIDVSSCPNTNAENIKKAVRFLLYKRFKEESISGECFQESLHQIITKAKDISPDILSMLLSSGGYEETRKFCHAYNIAKEERPYPLRNDDYRTRCTEIAWDDEEDEQPVKNSKIMDNTGKSAVHQRSTQRCDWEPQAPLLFNTKSLELSLRLDVDTDVRLIDTKNSFIAALNEILCYEAIGIDSEWKPTFGMQKLPGSISLIQIATWDSCYLLDFNALRSEIETWKKFFECLINCKEILKLGYGLSEDWNNIRQSLVDTDCKINPVNVLDLQKFTDWLISQQPQIFDATEYSSANVKGLSKLCLKVLGKSLNKQEQFSDWEQRPLRHSQKVYAALDAYCLLQIYETLHERYEKLGTDLQSLIVSYISGKCTNQAPSSLSSNKDHIKFPLTPVRLFKCITDEMLQGLGRNLRLCGANVIIPESGSSRKFIIEAAQKERRIVFSSGRAYDEIKSHLEDGYCFKVSNNSSSYEQLEDIINRFNLVVKKEDIFSRCAKCNLNKFENISSSTMRQWFLSKRRFYKNLELNYEGLNLWKFDAIEVFLLCCECGFIYWEGCHHNRYKKKIEHLLFPDLNESTKSGNDLETIYTKNTKEPEVIDLD